MKEKEKMSTARKADLILMLVMLAGAIVAAIYMSNGAADELILKTIIDAK